MQLTKNQNHEPIQPFTGDMILAKTNWVIQFTKDIKDTRKRSLMYPAEKHQGNLYLLTRCGDGRADNTHDTV